MKSEGDPVLMKWIIPFYPKNGLDGALLGTSQTKKNKCIGSNMVNHAQNWSWVKIFFDLPNKHIPIQYWHPASGHSSGWNVTANFPDCIGSRSSVAVLSWSRDTSVNYQAPSFQSGSGNLNPSSSFRKRDEEWLGGEIGGNYLLLISQTDRQHNTWLMPHLGLFQHRGFVELESDTLGLTGGMRQ